MDHRWVITKLSSLGTFDRGKSKHRPRDASHLYGGQYPFIQTGDITASGGRITCYKQTYSEAGLAQSKLWPSGTLCITIAANIADTALLTFPACFPDSVVGFIPYADKADVRFIEFMFRAFRANVKSKAYGSVQENINLEVLRNLAFPIPDLGTQKIIADFLTAFDDRIALLRETNVTLESIAQTLFKSWFIDFDPVHAKAEGREPEGMDAEIAALFPASFEKSEFGLIPRGWYVGRISNLGEVICGKTPLTSNQENYGSEVPFITIPDMHNRLVVTSTQKKLSHQGAGTQKNKYLRPGSICVSCIATAGLVVAVTEISQTNQQINSVVPDPRWTDSFPLFVLRQIGEKIRAAGSGGSVFDNLNKSRFEKTPILLPDPKLAQKFDYMIAPLVSRIIANQKQAEFLSMLCDTLLPRLISGQLRLSQVEYMESVL